MRSRSVRCGGGGSRSSWSSSSTRCSACATAAGGCPGASIRRRTGRWAAACRRAWAIWTRTSTAGGWTRRCALFVGGERRARAAARPRRGVRCARRPPSSSYERAGWLRRRARGCARSSTARRGARGDPRPAAAGARRASGRAERRRVLARRRAAGRLGAADPPTRTPTSSSERTLPALAPRRPRRRARAPTSRPTRSTRSGSSRPTSPRIRTRRSWCSSRRRETRTARLWPRAWPTAAKPSESDAPHRGGQIEVLDDAAGLATPRTRTGARRPRR